MPRSFTLPRVPRRRADRARWTADDLQVLFETSVLSRSTARDSDTPETRALVAAGVGAHLR